MKKKAEDYSNTHPNINPQEMTLPEQVNRFKSLSEQLYERNRKQQLYINATNALLKQWQIKIEKMEAEMKQNYIDITSLKRIIHNQDKFALNLISMKTNIATEEEFENIKQRLDIELAWISDKYEVLRKTSNDDKQTIKLLERKLAF